MSESRTQQRDMTIKYSAFMRSLQPLERNYRVTIEDPQHIIVTEPGHLIAEQAEGHGAIRLNLGPQTIRKVATLRLPAMLVEIDFQDVDDEVRELFLYRFDLCFRRGGG